VDEGLAAAGYYGGGKPLFSMVAGETPPPPHNDDNPNMIRLSFVWQPTDTMTLDPLGKGAILAFGAVMTAELLAIGSETVEVSPPLGALFLAAGFYGR